MPTEQARRKLAQEEHEVQMLLLLLLLLVEALLVSDFIYGLQSHSLCSLIMTHDAIIQRLMYALAFHAVYMCSRIVVVHTIQRVSHQPLCDVVLLDALHIVVCRTQTIHPG